MMKPPNDKDIVALIVATICFVILLIDPSITIPCGIIGIAVLLLALARQM
jgi:hypothetical protein